MRAACLGMALHTDYVVPIGPREREDGENAVIHPVQIVVQKAEHVGQREAFCNRGRGGRERVRFVRRVRMR